MRRYVCALLAASSLLLGPVAHGQSASDKATARQVATEGIELFRAGKYEDALDRLRRAQSLYDAPVHLLYIARAQEKLGQLVEAAENYRLLDRYTLPGSAPEAWVTAQEDGRKELAALEPRVPKVRIVTDPKDVPEATVKIDDEPVSAAVLGIARPVNPGHHRISVARKGGSPGEAEVDVAESETKDVAITVPAEAATGAVGSSADATASPTGAGSSRSSFGVGFLFGLRLGAAIPTGKLFRLADTDLKVSDGFKPGGALELRAGVRLAHYFTPLVYFEGASLAPGDGYAGLNDVKDTSATSFGLGVMVGTAPGKIGGFGEVDLAIVNTMSLSYPKPVGGGTCDVSASGAALRLAAGGTFPLTRWLQVSPFASALFGRFTRLSKSSGCPVLDTVPDDIPPDDVRTHGMIVLGVGGDILAGSDLPK